MGGGQTHTGGAIPPLMSQQTTAKSKELRKGNTEIKTAANVFSDIPIEILIILVTLINHLSRPILGVLSKKESKDEKACHFEASRSVSSPRFHVKLETRMDNLATLSSSHGLVPGSSEPSNCNFARSHVEFLAKIAHTFQQERMLN